MNQWILCRGAKLVGKLHELPFMQDGFEPRAPQTGISYPLPVYLIFVDFPPLRSFVDIRLVSPLVRNQYSLDDFLDSSANTHTFPPGSTSQIIVEPCSSPSNAATASGIVQRTDGERDITRVTFDLNILDKDSPITLTAGRLNNFGLNVGIPIGQKINTTVNI